MQPSVSKAKVVMTLFTFIDHLEFADIKSEAWSIWELHFPDPDILHKFQVSSVVSLISFTLVFEMLLLLGNCTHTCMYYFM